MTNALGPTINRRKFLECVGQGSLLLGLPSLSPQLGVAVPRAVPGRVEIPGARPLLNTPFAQQYLGTLAGPFWVAGRFLNQFKLRSSNYLDFDKLDPSWRRKYQRWGGRTQALS